MSHRFIPPIPVISYLRGAAKGEERAEGACQRYGMMHRDQMLITHVEDPLKNHPCGSLPHEVVNLNFLSFDLHTFRKKFRPLKFRIR